MTPGKMKDLLFSLALYDESAYHSRNAREILAQEYPDTDFTGALEQIIDLRQAVVALRALCDWLQPQTVCPCCVENVECLDDCTFAVDDPDAHERMETIRDLLSAVSPKIWRADR